MELQDVRWKQRFDNYQRALQLFSEAVHAGYTERIAQEGVIQRFEFTFELAWKCLQGLLQSRGLADIRGPKPVLQQALQDGLITQGLVWMEMLRARNDASQLYDEQMFLRIYEQARDLFLSPMQDLQCKLASLL